MSNMHNIESVYPHKSEKINKRPSLFKPNQNRKVEDKEQDKNLVEFDSSKVDSNELINKSPRDMIPMKQIANKNQQLICYLKNEQL